MIGSLINHLDSNTKNMNQKHTLFSLLILFVLLASCATQTAVPATAIPTTAPLPSDTPAPTDTLSPTATMVVVATLSPTDTPTSALLTVNELIPIARDFIDELNRGDFAAAFARFDETMKEALSEDKLKELWQQLILQVGEYQSELSVRTESKDIYSAVIITSQFSKTPLDVRVVFDLQGKIAGLFFTAVQAQVQPVAAPAYANPESFEELDVTVSTGPWALPGTLTLPKGDGPFPAVVMVHGSGPNDRDETIGPNKPFRDLAWGLASRGIAVLRYDKRTYTHAAEYTTETRDQITLQDETITDALQAVQLLRNMGEAKKAPIDPKRIYVLGHSLGALAAPRIGQQDPDLAGLILLAGPSRPLEDVVFDQYKYLFELQGSPASGQADMDAIAVKVARVKDPNLSTDTPSIDLPLGLSAAYWLYLRDYDAIATAQALTMPMLILQGGRDYHVLAEKDFTLWESSLAGKPNVNFNLYPDLNHLFITGVGKSTPEEYDNPRNVSQKVVEDIAAWFDNLAP